MVLRWEFDHRWSDDFSNIDIDHRKLGLGTGVMSKIDVFVFWQAIGASLDGYPNIKRWNAQCADDVKGFKENDEGAKRFGEAVKGLLHDKF